MQPSGTTNNKLALDDCRLKLFLLNIQSLRYKTDELTVFLESINNPEILLLTEHWLKEEEPCHIFSYKVCSKFCRKIRGHGGAMILVREDVLDRVVLKNVTEYDYLLKEGEFEFSIVYNKQNNIYIVCIYRPPGGSVDEFLDRLEILLSNFSVKSKIILAGDLNINFKNENSICVQNLQNLLTSFNLNMLVSQSTRITGASSTLELIIYVLTSVKNVNVIYL